MSNINMILSILTKVPKGVEYTFNLCTFTQSLDVKVFREGIRIIAMSFYKAELDVNIVTDKDLDLFLHELSDRLNLPLSLNLLS